MESTINISWKRLILLGFVIMATSVDEGEFVYSAASSDWTMSPADEYVTAWINLTYMDGDKLHTEKTEIGKFGTGKVGLANGLVVHVTSVNRSKTHFGCEFPYGNQLPNEPWIALVKRGNCTFDEKLRNAYRSNASALVVYAKEDKETLDKMNFKECTYCNIPTVFTYRWKGEEIARIVDHGTRVYMYITVGDTVAKPYSGINRTSVFFVSVSFIILMIISLAWLVFYYVQRFRYLHAKDRLAQRLCNAAKKALAKIPTRKIKLTDKDLNGDGECCAVCIELYRSGETVRTLPCRHEFHMSCVDIWLLQHRTCPMCKMDILKYYGYIFTGSQESILHLDLEDGALNSSESRETESPFHDDQRGHQPRGGGVVPPNPTTALVDEVDQPTTVSQCQSDSERNPSLVSVTVVSIPKGFEAKSESKPVCSDDDHVVETDPQLNSSVSKGHSGSQTFLEEETPNESQKCVPVTVHQLPAESSTSPQDCKTTLPRSQSMEEKHSEHIVIDRPKTL